MLMAAFGTVLCLGAEAFEEIVESTPAAELILQQAAVGLILGILLFVCGRSFFSRRPHHLAQRLWM
jgi:hypothetical protein